MKLKKLSLPEWLLIAAAVAIMLVNVVLQIEALRYLMWFMKRKRSIPTCNCKA